MRSAPHSASVHTDVDDAATALVAWQTESCGWGFGGWLAWLWGGESDPEVITLDSGDGELATAVSPATRPDPCDPGDYVATNLALGRPFTASQDESEEYGARQVNDGSLRTWWSAADGTPHWVEIDLESEQPVDRIETRSATSPRAGPSATSSMSAATASRRRAGYR